MADGRSGSRIPPVFLWPLAQPQFQVLTISVMLIQIYVKVEQIASMTQV